MAEEDFTRTGTDASGRGAGHRAAATAARHRSGAPVARRARAALGRSIRPGAPRRWVVAGLTLLTGLTGLLAYVGTRPGPEPVLPSGVPAGVGRPTGYPAVEANRSEPGPAAPGLRPRQRPPSPPPSPTPSPSVSAPASPQLSVSQRDIPAEVDLTAVGSRDWVHWGLRGNSTVRKRGGTGEILDEGGRGRRGNWDGNQEVFSWRDGGSVRSAHATSTGVFTCGAGNGFSLAVAGSGELRTVRLYAGLWMARGRLEARLSTGGPATTLRLEDPHTSRSAEFTVRFRAPKDARLLISWTTEAVFSRGCGNVGLQAVALR